MEQVARGSSVDKYTSIKKTNKTKASKQQQQKTPTRLVKLLQWFSLHNDYVLVSFLGRTQAHKKWKQVVKERWGRTCQRLRRSTLPSLKRSEASFLAGRKLRGKAVDLGAATRTEEMKYQSRHWYLQGMLRKLLVGCEGLFSILWQKWYHDGCIKNPLKPSITGMWLLNDCSEDVTSSPLL